MSRSAVVLFCLVLSACGPDRSQETPEQRFTREGEELFLTRCTACHQRDARGLPGMFPPLAGSPWLLDRNGAERAASPPRA